MPSANGAGTSALMTVTSAAKTGVWSSWQRFMAAGADGLLRHETRPPDPEPLANCRTAAVVEMTLKPPHSGDAFPCATGRPTVRLKRSTDTAFAEKPHDVVGRCVSSPAYTAVVAVDEKSQIQAPRRTQPGLPLKGAGAKP